MNISVTFRGEKKLVALKEKATASDLLKEMKINSETVLVAVNEEIVPEMTALKAGDEVELIRTISGG